MREFMLILSDNRAPYITQCKFLSGYYKCLQSVRAFDYQYHQSRHTFSIKGSYINNLEFAGIVSLMQLLSSSCLYFGCSYEQHVNERARGVQ